MMDFMHVIVKVVLLLVTTKKLRYNSWKKNTIILEKLY